MATKFSAVRDVSYFEMNLENWRQLWRVLEMSDIILLIADIRYPVSVFSKIFCRLNNLLGYRREEGPVTIRKATHCSSQFFSWYLVLHLDTSAESCRWSQFVRPMPENLSTVLIIYCGRIMSSPH
jgi:hypothetical protein